MSININLKSCCETCTDCKLEHDKVDLFNDDKICGSEIILGCEHSNVCKKYIELEETLGKIELGSVVKPIIKRKEQYPYEIPDIKILAFYHADELREILTNYYNSHGYITVFKFYLICRDFKEYIKDSDVIFQNFNILVNMQFGWDNCNIVVRSSNIVGDKYHSIEINGVLEKLDKAKLKFIHDNDKQAK